MSINEIHLKFHQKHHKGTTSIQELLHVVLLKSNQYLPLATLRPTGGPALD